MKSQTIAFSILLCASGALHAQAVGPDTLQQYQSMMQAMQAAEAAAKRPGDEKLDCEQLQKEFAAVTTDPALVAGVQSAGESAQADMAAIEAAQAKIPAQTAATAAAAIVPGASMPVMAAQAADAEAQKAQAAARMQSKVQQAQGITALMPTLMRGERLLQLATVKKCSWAADAAAAFGTPVPATSKP